MQPLKMAIAIIKLAHFGKSVFAVMRKCTVKERGQKNGHSC